MSDPTVFADYSEYVAACTENGERPANELTWSQWKYPRMPIQPGKSLEQRVTDLERRMDEMEGGK